MILTVNNEKICIRNINSINISKIIVMGKVTHTHTHTCIRAYIRKKVFVESTYDKFKRPQDPTPLFSLKYIS